MPEQPEPPEFGFQIQIDVSKDRDSNRWSTRAATCWRSRRRRPPWTMAMCVRPFEVHCVPPQIAGGVVDEVLVAVRGARFWLLQGFDECQVNGELVACVGGGSNCDLPRPDRL